MCKRIRDEWANRVHCVRWEEFSADSTYMRVFLFLKGWYCAFEVASRLSRRSEKYKIKLWSMEWQSESRKNIMLPVGDCSVCTSVCALRYWVLGGFYGYPKGERRKRKSRRGLQQRQAVGGVLRGHKSILSTAFVNNIVMFMFLVYGVRWVQIVRIRGTRRSVCYRYAHSVCTVCMRRLLLLQQQKSLLGCYWWTVLTSKERGVNVVAGALLATLFASVRACLGGTSLAGALRKSRVNFKITAG